jgi:hypothetical protein
MHSPAKKDIMESQEVSQEDGLWYRESVNVECRNTASQIQGDDNSATLKIPARIGSKILDISKAEWHGFFTSQARKFSSDNNM